MTDSNVVINKRYRVLSEIGAGGMGAVLLVEDRLTNRQVALKQVKLPAEQLQFSASNTSRNQYLALAIEFQMLASLRHPHIISVLDYGFDDDGQPYFTMDYLPDAQTLTAFGQDVDFDEKIRLIAEMLEALVYLHRRNIIHRDLKPANVLINSDHKVYVLDFGLATAVDAEADEDSDEIAGTLSYMAPELLQDETASVQSDVYAVGTMAYELFAGDHPFDITSVTMLVMEVLTKIPDEDPLDYRIRDVVMRWLDKDPTMRPDSARAAMQMLYNAADMVLPPESGTIRDSFIQASRFVGRENELTQLKAALSDLTTDKKASFWLIGGESGAGKSRLVDEIRIRALVDGVQVMRGQAVSDGSVSYQVWRNIIRPLIPGTELSDLEAGILKEIVPDIDRLTEREIPPAPPLEGTANQERLALTMTDVIRRQNKPLMLILEDLHWATASIEMIGTQVKLLKDEPVLIVGTYRNDETPDLPEKLAAMHSLILPRLEPAEIASLSSSMLGQPTDNNDFVDFLAKETEGNVYFIVEVVRALAEEAGRLDDIATMTLPQRIFAGGIQEVVNRRLSRMPEWTQPSLRLAAIAGRQLDEKMLAQAMPDVDMEAFITAGTNAAVFDKADEQWRFAHDKLREGLLATLDETQKKDLHRNVADAIEATYPDNKDYHEALANHLDKAGEVERALPYIMKAATYVVRYVADYKRGETLIRRGLALIKQSTTPDQQMRSVLLYQYGQIEIGRGDYESAQTHFEASLAAAGDNQERIARAYQGLSSVLFRMSDFEKATDYAQQSLEIATAINHLQLQASIHAQMGKIAGRQGDMETAKSYFQKSMELDHVIGNERGIAMNTNDLGIIFARTGDLPSAMDFFKKSLAAQRQIGDRIEIASGLSNLGFAGYLIGELDQAETYLVEAISMSQQIDNKGLAANAAMNHAMVAIAKSEFERAIASYDDAVRYARASQDTWGLITALLYQGHAYAKCEQPEQVQQNLQEAIKLSRSVEIKPLRVSSLILAARWHLIHERLDDAAKLVKLADDDGTMTDRDENLYLPELKERLGDKIATASTDGLTIETALQKITEMITQ